MLRRNLQSIFPINNLDAFIPAAFGFVIIMFYTRHSGIGISPDSVIYISTARNIRLSGAIVDFDAHPLVIFPVLYSFFLAMLMFITTYDPLIFGAILNCTMFFFVIYLCGWMLENMTQKSKWYKHLTLSCITISPCLLEIYSMIWSETLFILLLLFFFISLRKYFQTLLLRTLLVPAFVAAMACVTRYAGVTFIAAGCLLLLLHPCLSIKKKVSHFFIFSICSASFLIINLLRNAIVSTTLTGLREKSVTSLAANVSNVGAILCDWLPIPKQLPVLYFLTALVAVLGCVVTLVYYLVKKNDFSSFENIFAAFFITYSIFIIVSATFSRYEQITSRLFSATYIPFLCGTGYWFLTFIKKADGIKKTAIIFGAVVLAFAFQRNQYMEDYENYDGIKDAGIPGYTEDPWNKDSEIVNFLRTAKNRFQPGYTRYSNGDDGVYFFTGRSCTALPHKVNPEEIQDFFKKKFCYVIWMDDSDNPELIEMNDILGNKKMVCLRKFNNGAIYITTEIQSNTNPW
jgi:hypothetical protein